MEVRPEKRSLPLAPSPEPRLVHPTLWDMGNGMLGWRVRASLELGAFISAAALMLWNGAPSWSYALLVYVASRSSRLEDSARAAALQSTERVRLEAIEGSVDKLTERIDRVLHPTARRQS